MVETAKALSAKGLTSPLPITVKPNFDPATDPERIRADLEDKLTGSDALVLLYRAGPESQVIRTIRQVIRSRARDPSIPERVDLCQPHTDPAALGLLDPVLNVIVTSHDCANDCAAAVAARFQGVDR